LNVSGFAISGFCFKKIAVFCCHLLHPAMTKFVLIAPNKKACSIYFLVIITNKIPVDDGTDFAQI